MPAGVVVHSPSTQGLIAVAEPFAPVPLLPDDRYMRKPVHLQLVLWLRLGNCQRQP